MKKQATVCLIAERLRDWTCTRQTKVSMYVIEVHRCAWMRRLLDVGGEGGGGSSGRARLGCSAILSVL